MKVLEYCPIKTNNICLTFRNNQLQQPLQTILKHKGCQEKFSEEWKFSLGFIQAFRIYLSIKYDDTIINATNYEICKNYYTR